MTRPIPRFGAPHWLDRVFAVYAARERLFASGWGDLAWLESMRGARLSSRELPAIEPTFHEAAHQPGVAVLDGGFDSPRAELPPESRRARVRWLRPRRGAKGQLLLVLAGSREEGYGLRELLWGSLVEDGVDVLMLEGPLYGARRAHGQKSASVRTVSEHVLMNLATVEEAHALLAWARGRGFEARAVAGYSMGGYLAALVAATHAEPTGVAALAAGAAPGPVFTEGALSWSIDFEDLGRRAGTTATAARARLGEVFAIADLRHYSPPIRCDAAMIVASEGDAYVPAAETRALHAHWPGSSMRWTRGGHISSVWANRHVLRAAARDALRRISAG